MNNCLNGVIARTAQAASGGETYLKDGLRYCSNCHTQREYEATLFDEKRIVPVLCRCLEEKARAEELALAEGKRLMEVERLRRLCFTEPALQKCRFENAGESALISRARHYAQRFERMSLENIGAMFTGEVGSGKTFAAACIANALLDNGISVRMLSFPRLLADMQSRWEKSDLLREISECRLLILDDFGSERGSDYALEQLFMVIDTRYRSGKPLILTTNLTVDELKNPIDLRYERIYDRIVEMCVPIRAQGSSRRGELQRQKRERALALLGEEAMT